MVQNGIARKPMYMQMTREQQAQPAADRATLDRHDEKLIKLQQEAEQLYAVSRQLIAKSMELREQAAQIRKARRQTEG